MPSFKEQIPSDPNSEYFSLTNDGDQAVVKFEGSWSPVETRFGERNRVMVTLVNSDTLDHQKKAWDVGRKTLLTIQRALSIQDCETWCFRVHRTGTGPVTTYTIVPEKQLIELSPF